MKPPSPISKLLLDITMVKLVLESSNKMFEPVMGIIFFEKRQAKIVFIKNLLNVILNDEYNS